MVEHILSEISSDLSIQLCHNDPCSVAGSHAIRSPDCVFVKEAALSKTVRTDVDTLSKSGPDELKFHWYEILGFVELKLEDDRLEHHLSKPDVASIAEPMDMGKGKGGGEGKGKSRGKSGGTGASTGSASGKTTLSKSTNHGDGPSATRDEVSGAIPVHGSASAVPAPDTLRRSLRIKEKAVNPIEPPAQTATTQSSNSRKRTGPTLEPGSSKKQKSTSHDKFLLQCASYALEMLSHGSIRTHAFGILVIDERLELLFYDRSLHVRSNVVNFLENPALLVTVIVSLAKLSSKDWGYSPIIELDENTYYKKPERFTEQEPIPSLIKGAKMKLDQELILETQNILFQQHALIGRGTCVLQVSQKSATSSFDWKDKGGLVAKLCFSPENRTSESTILNHISDMIKSDPERLGRICNHLPEVLYHKTIEWDETGVQGRLAKYLEGKNLPYEKRVLRILIMTELFPIIELTKTATLGPAIKDIFNCYRWLFEEAGVLHRDISLKNLMYRKKDGKAYGVLLDFDMAIIITLEDRKPSSKQRTGTLPYMACDLLEPSPPKHVYRHDLESLFYVMLFLTTMYHNGQMIADAKNPLTAWFSLGAEALQAAKERFLPRRPPLPTQHFMDMKNWTVGLQRLFHDGYNARSSAFLKAIDTPTDIPSFDNDTLGGNVDFDKFQKILDRNIELPAERVLLE
ncbi:hypothetical protein AMATHDRAFT_200217 [Amanita thiersii Skay4041]|uniref:Protein kinase domain-containing protein n=1 Tax=Amanita thiersii Skay4041 TaxID=703135 RepID=A0A2A9N6R8_9AGAR|nr:hypothetical protein AMATHDRAFT_200217 [Amanita thiersii Skay4041]